MNPDRLEQLTDGELELAYNRRFGSGPHTFQLPDAPQRIIRALVEDKPIRPEEYVDPEPGQRF